MKLEYVRPKKAKGKTYYYFDAGVDGDGKRILTKLPDIKHPDFGHCYARAKAARTTRERQLDALTFDGLVRAYEKSPEFRLLAENTRLSYELYLRTASKLLRLKNGDSTPARWIERKDIVAMRDKLADTPGAANQALRSVGALFAWAVDNEKVARNPTHDVRRFAAVPHKEWPEALVEEALKDPAVGDAVALFFFTGQRIDDVVAMRWDDVFAGHMNVWVKKKDKQLKVAVMPELARRLSAMPRRATTILTNANGQPWSESGLRRKLQTWALERGHKVVPHGLRKNAVNALLEAGCTAAEVSGITDQSIQMIEHYAKGVNKLRLGKAAVIKLEAARAARNGA